MALNITIEDRILLNRIYLENDLFEKINRTAINGEPLSLISENIQNSDFGVITKLFVENIPATEITEEDFRDYKISNYLAASKRPKNVIFENNNPVFTAMNSSDDAIRFFTLYLIWLTGQIFNHYREHKKSPTWEDILDPLLKKRENSREIRTRQSLENGARAVIQVIFPNVFHRTVPLYFHGRDYIATIIYAAGIIPRWESKFLDNYSASLKAGESEENRLLSHGAIKNYFEDINNTDSFNPLFVNRLLCFHANYPGNRIIEDLTSSDDTNSHHFFKDFDNDFGYSRFLKVHPFFAENFFYDFFNGNLESDYSKAIEIENAFSPKLIINEETKCISFRISPPTKIDPYVTKGYRLVSNSSERIFTYSEKGMLLLTEKSNPLIMSGVPCYSVFALRVNGDEEEVYTFSPSKLKIYVFNSAGYRVKSTRILTSGWVLVPDKVYTKLPLSERSIAIIKGDGWNLYRLTEARSKCEKLFDHTLLSKRAANFLLEKREIVRQDNTMFIHLDSPFVFTALEPLKFQIGGETNKRSLLTDQELDCSLSIPPGQSVKVAIYAEDENGKDKLVNRFSVYRWPFEGESFPNELVLFRNPLDKNEILFNFRKIINTKKIAFIEVDGGKALTPTDLSIYKMTHESFYDYVVNRNLSSSLKITFVTENKSVPLAPLEIQVPWRPRIFLLGTSSDEIVSPVEYKTAAFENGKREMAIINSSANHYSSGASLLELIIFAPANAVLSIQSNKTFIKKIIFSKETIYRHKLTEYLDKNIFISFSLHDSNEELLEKKELFFRREAFAINVIEKKVTLAAKKMGEYTLYDIDSLSTGPKKISFTEEKKAIKADGRFIISVDLENNAELLLPWFTSFELISKRAVHGLSESLESQAKKLVAGSREWGNYIESLGGLYGHMVRCRYISRKNWDSFQQENGKLDDDLWKALNEAWQLKNVIETHFLFFIDHFHTDILKLRFGTSKIFPEVSHKKASHFFAELRNHEQEEKKDPEYRSLNLIHFLATTETYEKTGLLGTKCIDIKNITPEPLLFDNAIENKWKYFRNEEKWYFNKWPSSGKLILNQKAVEILIHDLRKDHPLQKDLGSFRWTQELLSIKLLINNDYDSGFQTAAGKGYKILLNKYKRFLDQFAPICDEFLEPIALIIWRDWFYFPVRLIYEMRKGNITLSFSEKNSLLFVIDKYYRRRNLVTYIEGMEKIEYRHWNFWIKLFFDPKYQPDYEKTLVIKKTASTAPSKVYKKVTLKVNRE